MKQVKYRGVSDLNHWWNKFWTVFLKDVRGNCVNFMNQRKKVLTSVVWNISTRFGPVNSINARMTLALFSPLPSNKIFVKGSALLVLLHPEIRFSNDEQWKKCHLVQWEDFLEDVCCSKDFTMPKRETHCVLTLCHGHWRVIKIDNSLLLSVPHNMQAKEQKFIDTLLLSQNVSRI